MKKNLRIVSAAAAALLAVAPVAAGVVPAANVATTVNAAQAKAGSLKVPAAFADTKKAAEFGTMPAKESQVETLQNYNNSEATAKKANDQLGRILAYNGLASNLVVNYVENVQTVGSKTTVTFQLATSDKDAKKALKDLGYKFETGHDEDSTYQVVKNGTENAKFSVVLDTKANTPADTSSEHIKDSYIPNTIFASDPNTAVNISAVANDPKVNWGGAVNGNIVYTDAKGAQHTALLHGDGNTTVYTIGKGGKLTPVTDNHELTAGVQYVAAFKNVTINLGNAAAGTTVEFVLPQNAWFTNHDKSAANVQTVKVNSNGVAELGQVNAKFYAYSPTDLQEVHFYSQKTGNIVTSGSVSLHAVNGKLNVASLFASMNREYVASQLDNGKSSVEASALVPQNDLRDQLEKQNVKVDDNGYFTAPASFTLNLNAKSILNGATASLPVTVNVDNATPSVAQETTKTVKIMHIATIYDKNGKATHEPALRAYNTVSVVSDPVTLKDEKGKDAGKFYKLAGKDQYIKVGNVDGTSRSLKHNSYVYKSTGKRRGKTVLKKNSSVTTYGKSFMIAGHQMYRIGENKYVKKANF